MTRRAVVFLGLMVGTGGVTASAGCTVPFTVSTGGSTAGTGGTGGGVATTTTPTTSSSAPQNCGGGCADDEYCLVPTCGDSGGMCVKVTTNGTDYSPVCGCDDVTYWNDALAAADKAVVRAAKACTLTATSSGACGATHSCPKGYCNVRAPVATAMCIQLDTGTCWVVPDNCQGTAGTGFHCPDQKCQSACELIKQQQPWYEASCVVQ